MSLLRGTLKSKFGFVRRFRDMSLDELDFTNISSMDTDYMLEDLDDDISLEFVSNGAGPDAMSKKRVRKDGADKCNVIAIATKGKISDATKSCTSASTETITTESEEEPLLVAASLKGLTFIEKPTSLETFIEKTPCLEEAKMESESASVQNSLEFEEAPEFVQSPTILFEPESSVDEILKELEYMYEEHRDLVVRKDGFIATPLHALKHLARKFNEAIHNEITQVAHDELKETLVRVEIVVGVFRGVGEAFHKRLASQMAALDLLIRVERLGSDGHVVPFAIFPGWRLSPRVCQDLMLICKRNGLKYPRYITKSNIANPEKPVCLVECYIGDSLIGCGESDLTFVARKLAASQAIEKLSGGKYPLEYVALGSACMTYGELVDTGNAPLVSDAKKQWVLNTSANDINQASIIVDPQELDALQQHVYNSEMQEIKRMKKDFKITVQTDSEQSTDRKVVVK